VDSDAELVQMTALKTLLTLAATSAVFAAAPAAHAAVCDLTPGTTVHHFNSTMAEQAIATINYQRVQQGLKPLHVSPGLTRYLYSLYRHGNPYSHPGDTTAADQAATSALVHDCGYPGDGGGSASGWGPGPGGGDILGDWANDPTADVIAVIVDYSNDEHNDMAIIGYGDDSGVVDSANHPPVASPDRLTIAYSGSAKIKVIRNDSDPGKQPVSLMAAGDTHTKGIVETSADGTINYTAPDHFTGQVLIPYTISDIFGLTATGTLTVTVKPNRHHLSIKVASRISLWSLEQLQHLAYPFPNSDAGVHFQPLDNSTPISFRLYRQSGGGWRQVGAAFSGSGRFGADNYVWLGRRLLGFPLGRYQVRARCRGENRSVDFSLIA